MITLLSSSLTVEMLSINKLTCSDSFLASIVLFVTSVKKSLTSLEIKLNLINFMSGARKGKKAEIQNNIMNAVSCKLFCAPTTSHK